MLSNILATSAHWVTGSAVGTKDRRVTVEVLKDLASARSRLLGGAIENVVALVGSVTWVTPKESGRDYSLLATYICRMVDNPNLLALPAAELLSIPLFSPEHPPGPPRTSPITLAPSE